MRPVRQSSILRIAVGSLSLLRLSVARALQHMHLLAINHGIGRVGDDGRIRFEPADYLNNVTIVVSERDGQQLYDLAIASVIDSGDAQAFLAEEQCGHRNDNRRDRTAHLNAPACRPPA